MTTTLTRRALGTAALALLMAAPAGAADLGGQLLRVGSDTTSPPMEYIDTATGQIVGFDVDVVNAICERINCQAEFITTGWDGIFAALQNGQFDLVASGVSITDERDQVMDFTDPYIVNSQAILTRVDAGEMSVEDFESGGLSLAAQANTTDSITAAEIVGRENVQAYDTFNGAVLALQNGDVDGVVINGANAAAYEAQFAGQLVVGVTGLKADPLGLVFQEGDPMRDAFNEGLAEIKADGTLDALMARYWTAE
ncbi:putative amino acid uptake ABC transporter periplasmic solute-binding protein precursor [Oceanicola granulosus HTCC2516]|uniref:Putative amino acid uptake ABC transporter periplasmic solute-binding protein n=1 Tax=Oceanicola granulosus (strain ATCC BAA-861 / DSM 15982 / KCTC 12143 / HTCC2516) TaxID=314256 RepID=Q2CGC7_OCEGH|nr:transporter substrate-binding domain-containing protein [Oceanicola granulosus]EAR51791.1 putative amino acid uptake ABC transporter periplasmic solute-binding protein precursor [Oceanicola granulosus HTCC2516]